MGVTEMIVHKNKEKYFVTINIQSCFPAIPEHKLPRLFWCTIGESCHQASSIVNKPYINQWALY